jgi:hypothetical protein
VLAVGLPLAACGSSSSSSSSGSTSGSAATAADSAQGTKTADLVAFSNCMRAHGVTNFPDLGTNGHGGIQIQQTNGGISVNGVQVNGPAFQSAMSACRSKLPNGGQPPPLDAARRAAALQFSQCMRSHGVPNFPDPTFTNGGAELQLRAGSGIDPNSPAFKAAQAACGTPFGKSPPGGS